MAGKGGIARQAAVVVGCRAGEGMPRSDRAALSLAVHSFERVEAYCLREDEEARRYALAAGARSVRLLSDLSTLDFDVAFIGAGGPEPGEGDLLPAILAETRECAMVLDVLDVEAGAAGGLRVTRDLGRGSREILAVALPVVLGVSSEATSSLYVSRYRRQSVVPPPPELRASPDEPRQEETGPWHPSRPRARIGGLAQKTEGSAVARMSALMGLAGATAETGQTAEFAHVIEADGETCARHLLRFLRHHGIGAALTASAPRESATADENGGRESAATPSQESSTAAPEIAAARVRRDPRPVGGEARGADRRPRPLGESDSRARRRGPTPL